MARVQVSRDVDSGLVAVGLSGCSPGVLPAQVRVLDREVALVAAGLLDVHVAVAKRTGGPVSVDLDDLVDRAEAAIEVLRRTTGP